MKLNKIENRLRKKKRIKKKIKGTNEKPRLAVFRSLKHIYAQLINDEQNKVLTGVSSLSKEFKKIRNKGDDKEAASLVGKLIAQKAKTLEIKKIVFDRSGYLYHGKVKALAEAARANGLEF